MYTSSVLDGRSPWAVVRGNCLDLIKALPEKSVDHVVTDPPYEAQAHTKGRRVRRASEGGWGKPREEPLTFPPMTENERRAISYEVARVVKRWSLVFCQAEAAHKWNTCLEAGGLRHIRHMVWVKIGAQPQLSGDRPGMGYETILAHHRTGGRTKWNGGGRVGVFEHNKAGISGERCEHQTQKPLGLMMELIALFTEPGDLVLDPYCGSGSTGVACLRLGRRFIGFEVDEKYAALATERLEAETKGLDLEDARAGQLPLIGGEVLQ